ncbi:hypothetical protein KFK09_011740 [Dendrobium nobile]|uniref:Uncharacterized protein n=1 Tax=Dendrobium nobile TaxID=94219 RepID=A0A8T3BFX1_DENNO|nr:hypothetical protein KFK09_011740 [Dendrobium nobile]
MVAESAGVSLSQKTSSGLPLTSSFSQIYDVGALNPFASRSYSLLPLPGQSKVMQVSKVIYFTW